MARKVVKIVKTSAESGFKLQRRRKKELVKISLEVDGRDQVPILVSTSDPTQGLRGNLITLNLDIYTISGIYIIADMKDCFWFDFQI